MTQTYGKNKLTIDQMLSNPLDAKTKGHTHYFTGNPCINGHTVPRLTKGYYCTECLRLRRKKNYKPHPKKLLTPEEKAVKRDAYLQANRAKRLEKQKEYNLKHKDHLKKLKQKYWQENKERLSKKNAEWKKNNIDIDKEKIRSRKRYEAEPEKFIENAKKYYQENREFILEKRRAYRKANKEKIKEQNRLYWLKKKKEKAESD